MLQRTTLQGSLMNFLSVVNELYRISYNMNVPRLIVTGFVVTYCPLYWSRQAMWCQLSFKLITAAPGRVSQQHTPCWTLWKVSSVDVCFLLLLKVLLYSWYLTYARISFVAHTDNSPPPEDQQCPPPPHRGARPTVWEPLHCWLIQAPAACNRRNDQVIDSKTVTNRIIISHESKIYFLP
jgi:hypothetical protein